MKDVLCWIILIVMVIFSLYLSYSYGQINQERSDYCGFICYKTACQKQQLNQVIKSECEKSKLWGKCISCGCSYNSVIKEVENGKNL